MTYANYKIPSISLCASASAVKISPQDRANGKGSCLEFNTHFSAIFKYAKLGVNRSAGIEAVTGSKFGANWEFRDFEITSRAVSSDGVVAI